MIQFNARSGHDFRKLLVTLPLLGSAVLAPVDASAVETSLLAGPDQVVEPGAYVTLGASLVGASPAVGGYRWQQVAGTPVALDLTNPARPKFTAPFAPRTASAQAIAAREVLTFVLHAGTGTAAAPDPVNVVVTSDSHDASIAAPGDPAGDLTDAQVGEQPLTAFAGADRLVLEGSAVQLDGSQGVSGLGGRVRYEWDQVAGPAVVLQGAETSLAQFTAPLVGTGGEAIVLRLVIRDDRPGAPYAASDEVTVYIADASDGPRCDLAVPSVRQLWPTDGTLFPVRILDGNPEQTSVSYTISEVTVRVVGEPLPPMSLHKDGAIRLSEPRTPDALHKDGAIRLSVPRTPDALLKDGAIRLSLPRRPDSLHKDGAIRLAVPIAPDTVLLRAETTSSPGQVRTYDVHFEGSDGTSSCTASVEVTVGKPRL